MAAVLFVVLRLINNHCCRPAKKTANDPSLPFQPPRRPTAVRSPSGQPTHYLKKSPSPNGTKPLPGTQLLTPNAESQPATPITQTALPGGFASSTVRYTEENEHTHHHHLTNGIVAKHLDGGLSPSGGVDCALDPACVSASNCLGDPLHVQQQQVTINCEHGKLGALVFKLHYLTERSALVVSVVRCRGLPGKPQQLQQAVSTMVASDGTCVNTTATSGAGGKAGQSGATDPYVKLQLLPEKQHKVKTRVVRNTRNPVYDEDFTFYGLSLAELSLMSLHFVVLSFDRYSRDDVIGEVVCPLSGIDLSQIENQQVALSKEIQPRSLKIRAQGRGELLTSLCWQPAASRLTVVLLKARNLPRMDVTGLADPYVKIYLLFNGQRIAKKKTHVKKRTLSPVFNESFAFDIPTVEVRCLRRVMGFAMCIVIMVCRFRVCFQGAGASLEGVSLELMLLDWDRVTKNEVHAD